MFGKLAEAKQQAEAVKQKLSTIKVYGTVPGGRVEVIADGNKKITDIRIDDALMAPEYKEELQELLQVAIDHAMEQAEQVASAEMRSILGNLMPGLSGF